MYSCCNTTVKIYTSNINVFDIFCRFIYLCSAKKRVLQQRPSMSQSNKVVVFDSFDFFFYESINDSLIKMVMCCCLLALSAEIITKISPLIIHKGSKESLHIHKQIHDTNTEKSSLSQSNSRTRTNCCSKHSIKNIQRVLPCSAPVESVCVGCVLLYPPSVSVVAVSVQTFWLINCILMHSLKYFSCVKRFKGEHDFDCIFKLYSQI